MTRNTRIVFDIVFGVPLAALSLPAMIVFGACFGFWAGAVRGGREWWKDASGMAQGFAMDVRDVFGGSEGRWRQV